MLAIDEELKVIQARRKELYDDVTEKQALNDLAWKEYQTALNAYVRAEESLEQLLS
jgi:hypothetical protein